MRTSLALDNRISDQPPVVVIVDDDPLIRGAMDSLFRSVGMETRCHGSALDALAGALPDAVCCFVVDVRMPQVGGFEFHSRLAERDPDVPIVFVTGHGDIPMTVKAMKAGAVDFLAKPFRDQDLLDAVNVALERSRETRAAKRVTAEARARYDSLTPREREVMAGVTRGLLNKQVAGELGLAEITVKLHRSSLMKKLGVRTVPDLVRLAESLGASAHES
ncbi:MAG: response regulator transcription factor [Sphingomonas sp.]|uniref:response regulator transcription factor n=1 Tax=Sphingomonas sp. TaxID=28214 RepID=UPI001B11E0E8|nr:response regulator [Sphingomonas sp.]MBO9621236.1 response regulator transcription factor [Sphingomonas sp.]